MSDSPTKRLDGVRVLVVDDHTQMRIALRRFLERAGCIVLEAGSPSEAVDIARSNGGSLDLVLIDLILPEMSGPECADTISEDHPNLNVVYMSGYAEAVSTGLEEDNTPVLLQKPFAPNELVDTILRVLPTHVPPDQPVVHV